MRARQFNGTHVAALDPLRIGEDRARPSQCL